MFKKLSDSLPNMGYQKKDQNRSFNSYNKKKSPASDLFDFLKLIERWEDIVGPKLAKVTIPLKNQGHTLTILTNHSAYSQSLSYMEDTLKTKLFKVFPQLRTKVKKFNFQVSTAHFDATKADLEKRANLSKKPNIEQKQRTTLHPKNPIYKKLKLKAQEEFAHIEDDQLREQMISLYLQNEVLKFSS